MDTIVDLRSGGGGHELLTETAVSGRLRSESLLADGPLASHLTADETPQFVLRNKKSGLDIDGDGSSETMTPGNGYQALAAVTDTRVLFVVGDGDGDQTAAVSLADVVQAKTTDSGFRSTALVIDTLDERTWSFPCRGDTAAVASVVDDLAQTWASAERKAEQAEETLQHAHELVQDGAYDRAADALSEVKPTIEAVIQELRDVGPAAETYATERTEPLATALLKLQGPVRAQRAASAHADAQAAWREGEYEQAARLYDLAVGRYEGALGRDTGPANEALRDRLGGACRERELLRVAPLVDADTARRTAHNIDEPESAATQWEAVLSKYRRVLALDWPDEGSFAVTDDRLQAQAASAAEDAIDDYLDAGRRRLGSADEFSVDGREQRAEVLYERSVAQFEQARQLAAEAQPERVDEIDDAIATVERRLDGNAPTEHLPAEELPVTEVDFADDEEESEEEAADEKAEEYDDSSVLGRIQAQKTSDDTSENGTSAQPADRTTEPVTNTEIRSGFHDLDEESFTEFVADLWEAQGWSTTVFSTTNQVVYDVVAMREEPDKRRLLLWTEHREEDEQVGPRAVERCATARDSSQGADSATLVTNALLRTAAKQRAEGLDVTVIDGSDLVELVRFENFFDRLDRATVEG